MTNYYFLALALPALQIGVDPDITFREFEELIKLNLSARDYAKTEVIRRFYDIQNIRAYWKKEPFDPRGALNSGQLEEALLSRTSLPEYVFAFLDTHDLLKERLDHFSALIAAFFNQEIRHSSGFLKRYLSFEREWRLVLTGFRAKRLGRDLLLEMQYEDPYDDFSAQILAQKDAKSYIPPDEFEDLALLFEEHQDNPLALHKAICEYRFQKIEEMLGVDMFSIDRILGYMAQLILAEKWIELDAKEGVKVLDQILENAHKAERRASK